MNAQKIGWDSLFFNGSIVDLNISVWSARLSVRPSELGIEDTEDVRAALTLGFVRLAPKKSFDRILAIRRAALKDVEWASFNFPFIRGARYVPESKIEALVGKLRVQQTLYDQEVASFEERYSSIRAEMLPVIRKALIDAACENIDEAMKRINDEYPDRIQDHFAFGWTVYAISGAKSKAAAEEIAEETNQVKGIMRSIVTQLRDEFKEKVEGVAKIVARGGKVPSTSIASCREVLARVREMNVFGDDVLTGQVRAFERILALSEMEARPGAEMAKDLDVIKDELGKSVEDAIAAAEAKLTGVGNRRLSL